ncbi:MAG: response regulator transcription factor [Paludibacteraceae bacterium]|nr:response regulator transcription factor [Paludibacteraceae bacterium]
MSSVVSSILLYEEDSTLAELMVEAAASHDYAVTHAIEAQQALQMALSGNYDLCICDQSLLEEIREANLQLPVIILSSHSDRNDIIAGYQAGCDDYVTKPFSMDILFCKIGAVLRRSIAAATAPSTTVFELGTLVFDAERQTLNGQPLRSRDNDILHLLCAQQGQVVERSRLLKTLWKRNDYFASRSLSVYINHLRHLLSSEPRLRIVTVHNKGYKIVLD